MVGEPQDTAAQNKRPWWVLYIVGGFVLTIATLLIIFNTRTSPSSPSQAGAPADSEPDAYTQTWEQSYADTTCGEWSAQMTDQQKFAASADILASAWAKIEKTNEFPPDRLIREFQAGISSSCSPASLAITDVTYLLYNTGSTFRP